MGTPKRLRSMLRHLLDLATPTLRDLAREAGISYHAIRQYRKGERTPSPTVLARLAGALRRHSLRVARRAAALTARRRP
jgi:transcriptional regulator with XRE-family HTH domain